MRQILLALSAFLLVATAAGAEDRCEPNPVFKTFPGEAQESCERASFGELELWRWRQPGKPEAGTEPFRVEGEYWYYLNILAPDAKGWLPGKLEVRRNYENAVRQAGGEVLHGDSGKLTFRLPTASGEFFGESGCARGGQACEAIGHKLIRVATMPQRVSVLGAVAAPQPLTQPLTQAFTKAPCACSCECQPQQSSGAPTRALSCACQCQCDEVGSLAFLPGPGSAGTANRPALRPTFPTPGEATLFPSRGTRNLAVVIAGAGVGQAEAVLFGETTADILENTAERILVRVPAIPSEAVSVHLQMPTGRVTLRQTFQVYQAPDESASVRSPPCPQPYGDLAGLALEITAQRPQSVQPGQMLTLTVPGIGALRERLQREAQSARQAGAGRSETSGGNLASGLPGASASVKHIGVAFTHIPNAPGQDQDSSLRNMQDLLDAVSGGNGSQARPVAKAETLAQNQLTVRVPDRAVSGPIALVILEPVPLKWNEYHTLSCRSSGPGLLVAPPR